MRFSRSLTAAVLFVISVAVMADEPKTAPPAGPKSPAALAAIAKHRKTTGDAERAFTDAKKAADQQLVAELKKVQADVMKSGGPTALAEAQAIQAVIDHMSSSGGRRFMIDSRDDWQNTVHVRRGERWSISATGQWCASTDERKKWTCGPAGMTNPLKNVEAFYLEARIGDGPPVRIGAGATITADRDGMMQMQMMETGFRKDNDGSVAVVIRSVE